ncbi:MAG: MnhB domain-containing protein [Candidatus Omnitrophota bacterium]
MNKRREEAGMSLIVKTVTRLTVGLILLYGIYIVTHGHVSPGGGFAGGLIIALSFVHLMLAFGKDVALAKLSERGASFYESLGALLFWFLAILGFAGGYYFLNFLGKGEPFRIFSAGMIPLYNIAIAMKVSAGLFSIFMALIFLRIIKEKDK